MAEGDLQLFCDTQDGGADGLVAVDVLVAVEVCGVAAGQLAEGLELSVGFI